MLTAHWNNAVHNELLGFSAAHATATHPGNRSLRILISLAAGDGVYDIEELRYDLDDDALPEQVRLIAQHLLDRTGIFDLSDLQLALVDALGDRESAPFCPDGCRCQDCREIAWGMGIDLDQVPA